MGGLAFCIKPTKLHQHHIRNEESCENEVVTLSSGSVVDRKKQKTNGASAHFSGLCWFFFLFFFEEKLLMQMLLNTAE